jgi:small conductance mechanosensitive channel
MGSSLFGMQARTAQEMAYIAMSFISKNILNIAGSLIMLVVGWFVAKLLANLLKFILLKNNADITITKFLADVLKCSVMVVVLLIALGNFGITIAPFVAGLGAAGFGLSFAFQGPLSNYAAGATLIFTKPFKVGDILEVNNQIGQVEDMTLARTIILTLDGTRIIVPNKKIIGEIMHNYSQFKKLDIKVGVSYSSDIEKAVRLVKGVVEQDKRVARKPEPKIGVSNFADSSITVYARIWCKQADYWDVMFAMHQAIFESFKNNGITIPFPQRDVHMIEKGA